MVVTFEIKTINCFKHGTGCSLRSRIEDAATQVLPIRPLNGLGRLDRLLLGDDFFCRFLFLFLENFACKPSVSVGVILIESKRCQYAGTHLGLALYFAWLVFRRNLAPDNVNGACLR